MVLDHTVTSGTAASGTLDQWTTNASAFSERHWPSYFTGSLTTSLNVLGLLEALQHNSFCAEFPRCSVSKLLCASVCAIYFTSGKKLR